jgi:hypothetical protein
LELPLPGTIKTNSKSKALPLIISLFEVVEPVVVSLFAED